MDFNLKDGIITDSGKFEGETLATPYFYEMMLNGDGSLMEVSDEEKERFGIAEDYVLVVENEQGFVSLEFFTTRDEAEKAENYYYYADGYAELEGW